MQPYDNVYKKGIAGCVCIGPTSVDFRTPIPRAWIISRFEPVNKPKTEIIHVHVLRISFICTN